VHGVGSATGLILVGLLANSSVNAAISQTFHADGQLVSLAGGPAQLANQIRGVVFTASLAAVATLIILKLVDLLMGLRVSAEEEDSGLDLTQHGERAYND
jgi:Amt family ammonium transporter